MNFNTFLENIQQTNSDITESFSTEFKQKIEGYIVDACREIKISIHAIEFDGMRLKVYFPFGDASPAGYKTDKNEIAADIKEEVTDILGEEGHQVAQVRRGNYNELENISLLTFQIK